MRDPSALALPPRGQALADLAALLTEAPWTVVADDLERLRTAGVSDEGVVQAVTIAAIFNHLTRVADGTGVEPDYASTLPRLQVDVNREPVPRPEPHAWPSLSRAGRLPLSLRPQTAQALAVWQAYARSPSEALSMRDRSVVGSAVAHRLCDAGGAAAWGDAPATSSRESALAAYAETLTMTPWRVSAGDLVPLRREGLDGRGLLDVIGLVGFQNMESRVRLALGQGV